MNNIRDRIINFTKSDEEFPVLAALAAGLYPLLFYYYSNFTLLNSWEQFVFFLVYFLVIPVFVFKIATVLIKRINYFKSIKRFVLPLFNFGWSAFLMVIITKGFNYKFIVFAVLGALILAVLFSKHFKKIIVFQFLLAVIVAMPLCNYMLFGIQKSTDWITQPDDIERVELVKKPNIYFIQPDGYANFTEINGGYYDYDNSVFKQFLSDKGFKLYNDYRSNYYSTLSSNSSMFAMKHHYHNFPTSKIREVYNARDIIVGDNPVLRILKNNKYKTHLLLDKSYMLINRPDVFYDYCNIQANDLSYFSRGFQLSRDIFSDLKTLHHNSIEQPSFYFIEELSPSHVTNRKSPGNIADIEREKYLERLELTNIWLKNIIDYIEEKDPNSLIVIGADHGGFVGMNTTLEARSKLNDRDLIYSIYTAQLAIKWPDGLAPEYDTNLKTPVNLFRVMFSFLSDNQKFLNNLQEDKSYIQIETGAPFGVYEYINENGEVTFKEIVK